MPYPPAPWRMHGQLWLSLFRVREGDHPDREPGVYGVALVSYEDPSPLTYSELLVARPLEKKVTITDIWVDSADSRDGGRELWAIPKGLCDFSRRTEGHRVQHTTWETSLEGTPIASARFADVSHAAPRVPFKGATLQTRPESDPRAGSRWSPTSPAAPGRCRRGGRGPSTPTAPSAGWPASAPSPPPGWPTSRCPSADARAHPGSACSPPRCCHRVR